MGNDPAKMADLTKYLRSPENRAKIAALMPDDAARAEFEKRLSFEIGSSELTNRALGNSATARRLAERKDAENIMGDLVLGAIGQTGFWSMVSRATGAVAGKTRDTFRSRSDRLLADLLTNPQAMPGLQSALSRVSKQSGIPPVYGAAIAGENALIQGR
jgi:PHD/YefM family antitoxin component YafN of YafNO toxin-antitoxin module